MGRVAPPVSLSHPGTGSPRIVIAPNAFKGTVTAVQAAQAMARAARRVWPDADLALAPIADGGDGSVDSFISAGFRRIRVTTTGPTGEPIDASIAVRGDEVVVELADSCGMARLPGGIPAPMTSSTRGLGDAIRAALDHGAQRIVVCIGGSASTDGGAGMLSGLGARLRDAAGDAVEPCGASLARITTLDLGDLDPRLAAVDLVVAADVASPLLGPDGAAAVFAPQKGATPDQVDALAAGLATWSRVMADATGRDVSTHPGAGAAGGTGAALLAMGARLRPGFVEVAALVGLPALLEGADAAVTGEGRLDEQSALGKGSLGVAALARERSIPVIAVCGEITLADTALRAHGVDAWSDLASVAHGDEDPRRDAEALIERATARALVRAAAG